MKTVLFYGDSNTWGFDPETCGRYPYESRWTTVCANILGPEYCCIPAGMNGRTTVFDDPVKGCRNGISGLDYELQTHKPLDLLVIMLGTNDLKYTDAKGSAEGMKALLDSAISANERFHLSSPVFPDEAKILLVAPAALTGSVNQDLVCDEKKEMQILPALYRNLAEERNLYFLNAAEFSKPSEADGVHLGTEGHLDIGRAVAAKIRDILPEEHFW